MASYPTVKRAACQWVSVLLSSLPMKLKATLSLLLVLCACAWAQKPPAAPASAPAGKLPRHVTLVLLHVNDVHGQTQERRQGGQSVGGYARLSTKVREIRGQKKPNQHVLLLHAGDEFSRGDELTRATLGAANITLLNQIGLDAFTPGNGDFYDGWENLSARAKQAKFPFLMANVSGAASGRRPGDPCVVLRAGPVKVGVIGLCFVRAQLPGAWGLKVEDPIAVAKRIVPELRANTDVVVALTHLGLEQDKKLAAEVQGIDVIVGGHSHTVLEKGTQQPGPDKNGKNVLICQAGDLLRHVGSVRLRLERTKTGYRVTDRRAELLPLDQSVKQDPAIKKTIAKLAEDLPTTKPVPASQPASAEN